MSSFRPVVLRLFSNIPFYKLEIFDDKDCCSKLISNKNESLCLYTKSNKVSIIATPLYSNYHNKIYLTLDLCKGQNYISLNFKRNLITSPQINPINTFFLTDLNYGLKINGKLLFNQIT